MKTWMKKIAAVGMVAKVATAPAVCLAVEAGNVTASTKIDALDKPLQVLGGAMTGAVPKIGVTIAAAGGALSWAMGTEQQVVKYATRAAMGGGIAMAAPSAIEQITGGDTSGCEF